MKKLYIYIGLFLLASSSLTGLVACRTKQKSAVSIKTVTVTEQSFQNVLYYAGQVAPLSLTPVVTSVDGAVSKMFFNYGDYVTKGQLLYVIKPTKQNSGFQETLTNYLKAQQSLDNSAQKMHITSKLYAEGLVSKDEYQGDRNSYFLDNLSFMQAQLNFNKALQQYAIKNFPKLSIDQIHTIKNILAKLKTKTESIEIRAPISGIALFPKIKSSADDLILPGVQVKAGQVLVNIGDLSGISTRININENDINHLHVGQTAVITGDAFPNIILHGYVKNIVSQAINNGDLPTFLVTVEVPKITSQQLKIIHVGMNAKIAITLKHKAQIMIPINAVSRKKNQTMVQILDAKTHKTKIVNVTTGATTQDSVVITSGLKIGDKVVFSN